MRLVCVMVLGQLQTDVTSMAYVGRSSGEKKLMCHYEAGG